MRGEDGMRLFACCAVLFTLCSCTTHKRAAQPYGSNNVEDVISIGMSSQQAVQRMEELGYSCHSVEAGSFVYHADGPDGVLTDHRIVNVDFIECDIQEKPTHPFDAVAAFTRYALVLNADGHVEQIVKRRDYIGP